MRLYKPDNATVLKVHCAPADGSRTTSIKHLFSILKHHRNFRLRCL